MVGSQVLCLPWSLAPVGGAKSTAESRLDPYPVAGMTQAPIRHREGYICRHLEIKIVNSDNI